MSALVPIPSRPPDCWRPPGITGEGGWINVPEVNVRIRATPGPWGGGMGQVWYGEHLHLTLERPHGEEEKERPMPVAVKFWDPLRLYHQPQPGISPEQAAQEEKKIKALLKYLLELFGREAGRTADTRHDHLNPTLNFAL